MKTLKKHNMFCSKGMDVCLDGYQPVELTLASFNVLCQSSLEQTRYLYRHLYGQRQQNLEWENRQVYSKINKYSLFLAKIARRIGSSRSGCVLFAGNSRLPFRTIFQAILFAT